MIKGRIVLGMSGGVDSSVSAMILKNKGYEVIGVFMKNYSGSKNHVSGECSWRDDYREARKVAIKLGIRLYLVDYEKEYRDGVIGKMYKDYASGLTPNPDILCNKIIKFPVLFEQAKKYGADKIATGHYARIVCKKGKYFLYSAKDSEKDQSYFIYDMKEKWLPHIAFPIGDLTKEEVREIAHKAGFGNWDRKGTRGICFIGKMDMKSFLRRKIKEKKGRVIFHGKVVGEHKGGAYFTIGERFRESYGYIDRKMLGKYGNRKIYISGKVGRDLIVAEEGSPLLKRESFFVKSLHLINRDEKTKGVVFRARIRHLGKMHKGRFFSNTHKFLFDRPVEGLAEGQHAVFYSGKRVVGGGEIRF